MTSNQDKKIENYGKRRKTTDWRGKRETMHGTPPRSEAAARQAPIHMKAEPSGIARAGSFVSNGYQCLP
jgi:hypothetical protein